MAKTLLRSGKLDDFQSVGGGGQAVFASALQIRETLRLRKQQALVECLAIPQVNDDGDRVDWYSPVEGDVVAWKAAEDEQRDRALHQLETMADAALSLARKCQQSDKTAQQLFGALLEKALQFPGENHVFLVDGKPVITFWGFVNLNESTREELFGCLHMLPVDEPLLTADEEDDFIDEEPLKVTLSHADEPLLATPLTLTTSVEPEAEPVPEVVSEPEVSEPALMAAPEKKPRRLPLWSLPVAAVIVAAIAGPLLWPRQTTSAEPEIANVEPQTVDVQPAPEPLPELKAALPLHLASVTEPVKEEKPEPKPVVIAAIPKDALVMEADQMRAGTTKFLNGNWRVLVDVKDPVSGKPLSLRYQILNNKGSARLVHGDNVVCKADIFSGLHQNGELLIKSRGHARCSDGSRYPLPEISCKAGTSDVAECSGRYDASTVVPLTFRKVGA